MNFRRLLSFSKKKTVRLTEQESVAAGLGPELEDSYSPFLALPDEIILSITNFLPLHAAACLALCSRSMLRALGTQYWETTLQQRWSKDGHNQRGKERVEFLGLLQHDLLGYYLCYHCTQLHSIYALGPPSPRLQPTGSHGGLRKCDIEQGVITHGDGTQYRLRFPHVQLAMARHHYGSRYGIPLDTLSFTEFEERHDSTTLISIEARIVLNELLMRTQHWVLIPAERGSNFSPMSFTAVCPHLSTFGDYNPLMGTFLCKLKHMDDRAVCASCVDLIQCPGCPTECHLEIKLFGKRGTALVLTKWLSLGSGIDPEDPKWRTHLRHRYDRYHWTPLYPPNTNEPHSSIRSSFELQSGPPVEVLTKQNEKMLFTKRKENDVWKRSGGGSWMIVPAETKALMPNEHEGKGRHLQKQ